jgi:hypothetical protein
VRGRISNDILRIAGAQPRWRSIAVSICAESACTRALASRRGASEYALTHGLGQTSCGETLTRRLAKAITYPVVRTSLELSLTTESEHPPVAVWTGAQREVLRSTQMAVGALSDGACNLPYGSV